MSNIIKKERVLIRSQLVKEKSSSPKNERLCIELKIPKEKMDKEISIIKASLLQETNDVKQMYEDKLSSLEVERASLDKDRTSFDEEMKSIRETASKKAKEQGLEEGTAQGYEQGYTTGHKKGQQEFDLIKEEYIKHTKDLFAKIKEVNVYKKQIYEKTEPYIISLLEEIVKKAVSQELVLKPETIVSIVRQALHKMSDAENIKIKVNPQHYSFLLDNKSVLQADLGMSTTLEIVQSEKVQAGGCVIETDYGLVDSSVETKMIGIMEIINKVFDKRRSQVVAGKAENTKPEEETTDEEEESDNEDLLFDENLLEDEELSLLEEEDNNEEEMDEDSEKANDELGDIELDDDDLFKL